MSLVCEVGKKQLVKHGEVTCGDSVEVVRNPEDTVVVLSDEMCIRDRYFPANFLMGVGFAGDYGQRCVQQ